MSTSHMPQQLYDAAQAFLVAPCADNERAVIDNLRCFHRVKPGAFIEYGCLEHGVVHVFNDGSWIILDPTTRDIHFI